jgi:hypothetical protein
MSMTRASAKGRLKQPAAIRSVKREGSPLKHLRASDIRGVAKLATETTAGIHRITEGVHQSVLGTLGISGGSAPGRTSGITGLVYRSIHGVTGQVAKAIDRALVALEPLLERVEREQPESPERERVLAILNGVMGDRLVATGNPFATSMSLRHRGEVLDWTKGRSVAGFTGKVAVLLHGLCLNDLQWRVVHRDADGRPTRVVDLGESLATELGYTPVYLRYNTGLHISTNGRELAGLLEELVAHWPVAVEEISLIGYSMGGLDIRSACHYAKVGGLRWLGRLKNLVTLGTPHHGSPVERAGNLLDTLIGVTPYSAPFGKLFQLRSAGITDLRHGLVLDSDWEGRDRFRRRPDSRQPVPLPDGVRCFALAATIAAARGKLADRLVGDGLVPVRSALGQHDHARHTLEFSASSQRIVHGLQHIAIPGHPEVDRQVVRWLSPRSSRAAVAKCQPKATLSRSR